MSATVPASRTQIQVALDCLTVTVLHLPTEVNEAWVNKQKKNDTVIN